ncbi:MAG TPA: Lrp/AsnC ligand binding domain-containing protein [Candidatus Eremiobacteraeota bacterium]|nr:MAG: DNA-binding transcriptional regulator AsnC [bacterium ADurb.Bin363]HPZ09447.1 Lrp/AsnC ligand binding domain-containing protein [Candidatus Eremiobacteraeota bacterium]
MISAYILLQVYSEFDKAIWNTLTELPNVVEAAWIYGEFDTLLKVEADSLDKLDEFIFDELRKVEGIKSTKTLLVAKMK